MSEMVSVNREYMEKTDREICKLMERNEYLKAENARLWERHKEYQDEIWKLKKQIREKNVMIDNYGFEIANLKRVIRKEKEKEKDNEEDKNS